MRTLPTEAITLLIDKNAAKISRVTNAVAARQRLHKCRLQADAFDEAVIAQRVMIEAIEVLRKRGEFTLEEIAATTPYHFRRGYDHV